MSPPISIAVAQRTRMESELVSRALTARRRQFTVLACVLTSEELLKEVAEHRPEVTVISSCLQGDATGGLKALRTLCASGLITHPIMLVDYSDSKLVTDAFSAGAQGVVCRDEPFESLCKCIQRVHAGQVWANTQQLHWILKSLAVREPIHVVSALGVPLLTRREEQIVQMVVECLPSGEIASKLGVSAHTVKNHLFRIYEKLGVSSRSELILYALSNRDGALQLKT